MIEHSGTQIKAIISDADGTLVDTLFLIRHGQYEAAAEYLGAQGISREHIPPYDEYESYINQSVGGPTGDTFRRTLHMLFEDHVSVDVSMIDFNELDKSLQPIQDRLAPLYVQPFAGLDNFFSWLGKDAIALGIFTSGTPHHIVRNFGQAIPSLGYAELYRNTSGSDHEKLESFMLRVERMFEIPKLSVVTAEDVTAHKPDPEGLLVNLDRLGIKAEESIVLGDHPVDIEAAKAAGINAIGITHGFGTSAELRLAGAINTASRLSEVIKMVRRHNSGEKLLF